ncbi:Protein FAM243B [Frankliniella fusca]|uniref:Protein FAM243B n=1 Tax=Frankliniella fusca TaxID=407009 RepID=A0AAE1GUK8_9NEOP|nr:Protein FAM243B [Frankliniella fusca]
MRDSVIRIIHRLYRGKISPTIDEILEQVRRDHPDFPYKRTQLYKLLNEMGFHYETLDKRLVIKNTEKMRHLRSVYLRRIADLRAQGYVVVYLDETWYDTHDVKKKGFTDRSIRCVLPLTVPSRGQRIIIVHAGSEEGFIDGALFLACKNIKDAMADYHSEMNAGIFEEFISTRLLPRIVDKFPGQRCAIVMDNAFYHSRLVPERKIPTTSSTKGDLLRFITAHGIPVPEPQLPNVAPGERAPRRRRQANNDELLAAIRAAVVQRGIQQAYVVDELVAAQGHVVVRLPPCHCELNPIERAWSSLKRKVRRRNTNPKLGASVVALIRQMERRVTPANWRNWCRKVRALEDAYRVAPNHEPVIADLAEDSDVDSGDD